jgi:predicted branched-subunit amino acid permease
MGRKGDMMSAGVSQWKTGLKDGVPIAVGYIAVSFTFGIVAKTAGLSVFQATLMSLSNITSAGQFAALGLIAASAPYSETAVAQLIINLRYCLMSCALSQKLDPKAPFAHRFFVAMGVTDEVFGVSVCREGKLNPMYSYGLMSVAIPGWTLGTFLGVMSGRILTPRLISALSVALYGMFLAVIIPPAKGDKVLSSLIFISMLSILLCVRIPALAHISAGSRIILLTVLIAGAAAVLFPIKESSDER